MTPRHDVERYLSEYGVPLDPPLTPEQQAEDDALIAALSIEYHAEISHE